MSGQQIVQDAYRPRGRPECLDPIRKKSALFVNRERTKQRMKSAELARRLGVTRKMMTRSLGKSNKEEFEGIGVEFLWRCAEALGYDVKIEFVPKGAKEAA